MELKRKWLLVIGVLFLALAGTNAFAANVAITTSDTAVLNQSFDADLVITGTDTVGAFDLTVTFDPSKVQITGITPGTGFSAPAQTMIDAANTAGTGGTLALSYLDVTMTGFTPAAEGTTAFTLELTPSSMDAQSITPGGTLTKAGFPPEDVTGNLTPLNFTAVDKLPVTVTASVDPAEGGGISNPGDKQWFEGDTPTYTITVNAGYRVSSLLVDGVGSIADLSESNEYTFAALTAPGPHTIVAGFTRVYTVTPGATPEAGGSIASDSGSDIHDAGTDPVYTITINDGYAISGFTVDEVDAMADLTMGTDTATYTIDGIAANTKLDVAFVPEYTITSVVTPEAGGSIDCGGIDFVAGSTPTCTVTVNDGYRVDQFTVDTDAAAALTDNSYKLPAMGADTTITLTFMQQFDITATVDPADSGTVVSESGKNTFDIGATPTYTVTPAEDFVVLSVLVNGEPVELTDGKYTFPALEADATIAATFEPDAHPVTPVVTGEGSIDVGTETAVIIDGQAVIQFTSVEKDEETGAFLVKNAADVVIKAAANEGYYVTAFVVGGEIVYEYVEGEEMKTTARVTKNVTAPMTAEATFALVPLDIIVPDMILGGTLEAADGEMVIEYGADKEFVVTPKNAAWKLTGLTVARGDEEPVDVMDDVDSDGNFTVTEITTSLSIVPTFEWDFENYHRGDANADYAITYSGELDRVIQLYNAKSYHCFDPENESAVIAEEYPDETGEDGYAQGTNDDLQECTAHSADYQDADGAEGPDWKIDLSELLQVIQYYNFDGYKADPADTEDGFSPVTD